MQVINLTQGQYTLVDDIDFVRLSKYKWRAVFTLAGNFYAKNTKQGSMASFILSAPKGFFVDHISGDTLDNRRLNLRLCIQLQNSWNTSSVNIKKGKYKGVSKNKETGKFIASITFLGKHHNIGSFNTALEAALAYDQAAKKYFYDFAKTNDWIYSNGLAERDSIEMAAARFSVSCQNLLKAYAKNLAKKAPKL